MRRTDSMNQVMVVSAARTPLGAFCGQMENLSEQQVAAAAMVEAVRRAGIGPEKIDEAIVGTAKQTSKPSNCGRHAMLLARLPDTIPAYTVQRQSASGLQAVANGYWAIRSGDSKAILAGGTESMSQIPFEIRGARYAFTERERAIVDAIPAQEAGAQPAERYGAVTAAQRADHCARTYGLSPDAMAAFAEESLRKARLAAEGGLSAAEIFPVGVKRGKKEESLDRDELLKQAALLAPPADGAAMCLLASPQRAEELGLPVLAELLSVGIAAADPRTAAMAAAKAGLRALERTGLTLGQVDIIELNETSAAECLAIVREWESAAGGKGLPDRMNPTGGALAMGNPWGAAGAILVTRAVYALRRRGGGIAMAVVTAEGGQGMAVVLKSTD
ncbi:MAG: thiolase family protein [Syntrophales bacterium]